MTTDQLLTGLKNTLLIPDKVTTFDGALKLYLLGAKSYIDSMLDRKPENDDLYNLVIIYTAQFEWLNKDSPRVVHTPVTLTSLIHRLKTVYTN